MGPLTKIYESALIRVLEDFGMEMVPVSYRYINTPTKGTEYQGLVTIFRSEKLYELFMEAYIAGDPYCEEIARRAFMEVRTFMGETLLKLTESSNKSRIVITDWLRGTNGELLDF